jgi:hypothetical protein
MKTLVIKLTPTNYTLPFSEDALTWFYSFYTAEQKTKYTTDLAYCESQGWIMPNYTIEDVSSIPNVTDHTTVWVDTSANSLIKTVRGIDVISFYNYFIQQNDNLKPIKDHFDTNPSNGSYSITLEN